MKYKPFKDILEIAWNDTVTFEGWTYGNAVKDNVVSKEHKEHLTVGYYIGETDETISVASAIGVESKSVGSMWNIPIKCIMIVRKLK